MLAFFCLGARYRPWRYSAAVRSRVFGDGAAPRRTHCSPQPRQHSVFRASGGETLSKSCLRRRFFCGEGGSYLVRGESGRSSMARSSRMRSRATGSGNILARCVLGGLAVTRFRRGAFPGVNPWQVLRSMHPKSPANRLSGTHGAQILPGRAPFRCTGPSNHARRADLAVRRSVKPPERPQHRCRRTARAAKARSHDPRNTAQEAAPPSPPGQQAPPTAPAPPPPLFANTSQ